ncbi:MAG: M15 family metallopeptidase [Kineosporiaceae bacterium]
MAHASDGPAFTDLFAARPAAGGRAAAAVLERPVAVEAPAPAPFPVTVPAPAGEAAVAAAPYRTRAERRAAERTGATPPWGIPALAEAPAAVEPVVPAPAPWRPVDAPAAPVVGRAQGPVTGSHHLLPSVSAAAGLSIDPEVFEANVPTGAQPVLPSRRELRAAAVAAPKRASRRTSAQRLPRAVPAPAPAAAGAPAAHRPGAARASHVAIVGTLGIATIAVPMSGLLAPPPPPADVAPASLSMPGAPQFPRLPREVRAVDVLTVIPATDTSLQPIPQSLARPRVMLVDRASRGNERSVLPGCDGAVRRTNAANGQLDSADLCTLWNGKHRLRADAAVALAKLNIAYQRRFGHSVCMTDSYRTLSEQRRLKAIKPGLAATPGTSEHGWGLAVDLCDNVERGGSVQYRWLRANAGAYGWANPDWALPGGSGPYEPWHWEFVAGE